MNRTPSLYKGRPSRRLAAGVIGLSVITALVGGAPVSAAEPSPVSQLSHALKSLTRYRVDVTVSNNKTSSSTLRIDVVRNAGSTSAHLSGSVTTATGTQKLDAVIVGSSVCIKIGAAASYRCVSNPQVAAQLNQDPSLSLTQASKTTTYRAAGAKVFDGVSCDGYAFKGTQSGLTVSGTLYIQHSTGRPCQDIVTTSGKVSGVSENAETVAVWSHYNDKNLTIPTVKK